MASIAEREREKYDAVHATIESYTDNSPLEHFLPAFLQMSGATGGTVLDAGTCSGRGALALRDAGFNVAACDLSDGRIPEMKASTITYVERCLWDDLSPVAYLARACDVRESRSPFSGQGFDYVVCADVLEHIPTEYVPLTIRRLLDVATKGVFLSISLVRDIHGIRVGEVLHETVETFYWWKERIGTLGHIVECRDLLATALFYVEPRK